MEDGLDMNILLVVGSFHDVLYNKIPYKKSIINKSELSTKQVIEVLSQGQVKADYIVVLDEGIDEAFMTLVNRETERLVVVTRDLRIKQKFSNLRIYFQEDICTSYEEYESILEEIIEDNKSHQVSSKVTQQEITIEERKEERVVKEKKEHLSLFSKFKRNKAKEEVSEDTRFKSISSGISRIIAVTGHRGVGVTSTAVNLAYEAAKRELKTILIDLDTINRTTNLYFGEFIRQVEEDEYMAASLIRCLAKPQDYKNCACQIKPKLWLSTLAYDFNDERLMKQFCTSIKLMNLLTVLRQNFNLIILDLPMEQLGQFQEVIQNIDSFALCCNNSQYSIITTLRNMDTYLKNENIGYVNAKSKLVISRYNDHAHYEETFFTPDKVSELFASDLSDAMTIKMPIAGAISSDTDFDLQMEQDIPITESNMIFKNYYSSILLRMMEGA